MADLWHWGLIFRVLALVSGLGACSKVEEKTNTTIAVEDRVVDLTVHSDQPDQYNFLDETAALGHAASGAEVRVFLAIPNILNLYRPDVVLSSIANIEINIYASSVGVNPDNIILSFVGESFTPFTSWNSRFSLAKGYEWSSPGGDVLDLTPATPGILKVEGRADKILNFNITQQLVDAVAGGIHISGFLLQVKEASTNSIQYLPIYTSNSSDSLAPKAVLTFNNSEVVVQ